MKFYHSQFSDIDIITMAFNGCFALISFYLTCSLIRFGFGCCDVERESTRKMTRFLLFLCIFVTTFTTVHNIIVLVSSAAERSPENCTGFGIAWIATYTIGLAAAFAFLWTRQHLLNANPNLAYKRRKLLKFFSVSTMVILVCGLIMVILAGARLVSFSNCSENNKKEKRKLYVTILAGIFVSLTVFGQACLLALFVLPLIKHQRNTKKLLRASGSQLFAADGKSQHPSSESRLKTVKRCLAAAFVCVLADVIAAVVTITIDRPEAKLVYDFNLLINAICCIFSFRTWRKMLLPCNMEDNLQTSPEILSSTNFLSHNENIK